MITAGRCTITGATRIENKRHRCYIQERNGIQYVQSYRKDFSMLPFDCSEFHTRQGAITFVATLLGIPGRI